MSITSVASATPAVAAGTATLAQDRMREDRLDAARLQQRADDQQAIRDQLPRRDRQQVDDVQQYQDDQYRLRQQRLQDQQRLDDQQRIQQQVRLEEQLRQRAEETRLHFERATDAVAQQRLQQTQSLFTGRVDVYL